MNQRLVAPGQGLVVKESGNWAETAATEEWARQKANGKAASLRLRSGQGELPHSKMGYR